MYESISTYSFIAHTSRMRPMNCRTYGLIWPLHNKVHRGIEDLGVLMDIRT